MQPSEIIQTTNTYRRPTVWELFFRLVQQAVAVDPTPYESLVKYDRFQR